MSGLYHHLRVEFPRGWLTRTTVAAPPAQTSTSRRCPACALATPRASWHRGVQGSETYVNSAANSDVLVDKARHSLDICRPQLELWLETHGLASRIPLPFASGTRQMLERGSRVLYLLPLGWAHVGLARNKSCSPLDARIRAYSQKLSKRASDGFKEQGSETYVNSGAKGFVARSSMTVPSACAKYWSAPRARCRPKTPCQHALG